MDKNKIKIDTAYPFEDEYVKCYHHEYKEMSNPQGAVWRRGIFIKATTDRGERFTLMDSCDADRCQRFFDTDQEEKAQALCDKIIARGVIDLKYWSTDYPVYGSPAWEEEDAERYANHLMDPANPAYH